MKSRKFVDMADNHGDMIDPIAESAFFEFMADFKPDVVIHSGDNWDFRNIRRGATEDEKRESMGPDWEAGSDFFKRYFSYGSERHFLRGNHDERVYYLLHNCKGIHRDYAERGVKDIEMLCRARRVNMLPYDSRKGVLRIGHFTTIHGYHAGMGAANCHARIYGNCFFGHTHTQDVAPVPNLDGPAEARGIGCLCQIDMPYNQHQTNKLRHQQGWVYGELFSDGTYQAFQTKRINNSFYVAQSIKKYGK